MKQVPGSLTLAAIIAVFGLAAGYWHFSDLLPPHERAASVPNAPSASPDRASVEARNEPGAETVIQSPPSGQSPQSPSVDLVRVEPDGSTLIAGQAEPMSEIVILNGETIVARERAGPSGDFAATLGQPLAVGDHELSIQSAHSDGSLRASNEVAIISVPPRGREQDLLVALGAPNAPTRLLAVPGATPADTAASGPAASSVLASRLVGNDAAASLGTPGDSPSSSAASSSDLSVAAVEIEGDRLYIAGTARPGTSVRIYLNDAFVAQAQGQDGGQFIAESVLDVPVGSHVVRIDELSPDGSVAVRVAVPFDRPEGTSMAALAPRPAGTAQAVAGTSTGAVNADDIAAPVDGAVDAAGAQVANAGSVSAPVQGALRESASTSGLGALGTPAMQAALEPVEGRVIIRRGDTLWRISRETYGLGSRYTVIYLANGDQILDPDRIYPGQVFRVPDEAG